MPLQGCPLQAPALSALVLFIGSQFSFVPEAPEMPGSSKMWSMSHTVLSALDLPCPLALSSQGTLTFSSQQASCSAHPSPLQLFRVSDPLCHCCLPAISIPKSGSFLQLEGKVSPIALRLEAPFLKMTSGLLCFSTPGTPRKSSL